MPQTVPFLWRLIFPLNWLPKPSRRRLGRAPGGPLQYRKQLRLQEARQLMLSQKIDAVSAPNATAPLGIAFPSSDSHHR